MTKTSGHLCLCVHYSPLLVLRLPQAVYIMRSDPFDNKPPSSFQGVTREIPHGRLSHLISSQDKKKKKEKRETAKIYKRHRRTTSHRKKAYYLCISERAEKKHSIKSYVFSAPSPSCIPFWCRNKPPRHIFF